MALATLVGVALAACSSKNSDSAGASTSVPSATTASPSVTASVPATPQPTQIGSPTEVAPAPTHGTAPSGAAVPSGFAPASVTFVSSDDGFALGAAPCAAGTCTNLVATADAGKTWHAVSQLPPSLVGDNPAVSKVRFATSKDGWVFGPQLWSTHDGGTTWRQLSEPQPVSDVEAAAGTAYALVGNELFRTPAGSDAWQRVRQVGASATMALHGHAIWIVSGHPDNTQLLTSADGTTWKSLPDPCSRLGAEWILSGVAPVTTSQVFLLCGGGVGAGSESKKVLFSVDAGRTAKPTSTDPPRGGIANGFAAASESVIAIAALSGASEIYRTGDAGQTWKTPLQQGDGGVGYYDLGFTTSTQGVAIYGQPSKVGTTPSTLLMTHDAGATWSVVQF